MEEKELVKGKIITKSQFSEKVIRLKIKNIEPVELNYIPGQYVSLKIWDKELVPYYIFKYYHEINAFEVAVDIGKNDNGANYIKSIGVSDDVEYTEPQGNLLLDKNAKQIYFIAERTYVSPLISYLYHLEKTNLHPTISLFWGVDEEKQLFLVNSIYAFSTSMSNFSYTIFMSEGTSSVTHRSGRVIDAVKNADFDSDATFYVCGEDKTVSEITATLKTKGVNADKILTEKLESVPYESAY